MPPLPHLPLGGGKGGGEYWGKPMKIPFVKMSGSGNDFILIDHRKPLMKRDEMKEFAQKVCRRRVSVGADGLILIERSEKADFKWQFFNADGSEAEMCGNGGRCAALFAHSKGIAGASLTFETLAGVLSAQVDGRRVKLEMTKPFGLKLDETISIEGKEITLSSINTGVPIPSSFGRTSKTSISSSWEGRFDFTLISPQAGPMSILSSRRTDSV